jgi:hypothetical protein
VQVTDLKRVGKAAGGSLNDAFVAAVLGGFRLYHEVLGSPIALRRRTAAALRALVRGWRWTVEVRLRKQPDSHRRPGTLTSRQQGGFSR